MVPQASPCSNGVYRFGIHNTITALVPMDESVIVVDEVARVPADVLAEVVGPMLRREAEADAVGRMLYRLVDDARLGNGVHRASLECFEDMCITLGREPRPKPRTIGNGFRAWGRPLNDGMFHDMKLLRPGPTLYVGSRGVAVQPCGDTCGLREGVMALFTIEDDGKTSVCLALAPDQVFSGPLKWQLNLKRECETGQAEFSARMEDVD